MFPLLDFDDDSIMVALGYSDAVTLSSVTMTYQRLRRLADESWTKVENVLSNSMKSTWTKNSKMGTAPTGAECYSDHASLAVDAKHFDHS